MFQKFIDLSHPIESGMITYRGIPAPVISDFLSREDSRKLYAPGTEFHIAKIDLPANTGTYVDSPNHRYADADDLSTLPLASLANLDGIVVRVIGKGQAIDQQHFHNLSLSNKAVLVHTGWAQHWRTEKYFQGHTYLTRKAAEYLIACEAALVGIDSYNIDSTDDPSRPAHSLLLKAGIPIVEHLRGLENLSEGNFRFFAVPPMIKGMGSFPVRAFAIITG